MNPEKILKKAKELDEIDIDPSKVVEVSFEDFCNYPGDIFKVKNELFTYTHIITYSKFYRT